MPKSKSIRVRRFGPAGPGRFQSSKPGIASMVTRRAAKSIALTTSSMTGTSTSRSLSRTTQMSCAPVEKISSIMPMRLPSVRNTSQPKLARLSRALQEHARDLFQCVGVGIVGPKSDRALEAVGAGYAADAEHRCCNLTRVIAPTIAARSLVLDDLENNLAVGARGDRIQNRADRLRGPPLLADHAPQIFLRHPQFNYRGGIALRLLHVHRVRIVYQLLCEELNELLHGIAPLQRVASGGDRCCFGPFN